MTLIYSNNCYSSTICILFTFFFPPFLLSSLLPVSLVSLFFLPSLLEKNKTNKKQEVRWIWKSRYPVHLSVSANTERRVSECRRKVGGALLSLRPPTSTFCRSSEGSSPPARPPHLRTGRNTSRVWISWLSLLHRYLLSCIYLVASCGRGTMLILYRLHNYFS